MDFIYHSNISPYSIGIFPHNNSMMPSSILSAISIALFFIFLCFSIACIFYVFKSLALYTMAKKRGCEQPWFAWIPFVSNNLLGRLILDQVSFGSLYLKNASAFLVIVSIVHSFFLSLLIGIISVGSFTIFLPLLLFVYFIVFVLIAIYTYTASYWLYRIYSPKNAVLFLILTIFIPFADAFILFSIRHHKPNFTGVPITRSFKQDTKSILALVLGILSIFLSLTNVGFMTSVSAIIFGITSYQEARKQNLNTTIPIIGIVLGSIGILCSIILPFIQTAFFGLTSLNHINHNFNSENLYPFI